MVERGKTKIWYDGIEKSHTTSLYTKTKNMTIVDSLGIDEIIDLEPQGLKLDCEGCEYAIIEKLDPTLFKKVIL